VDRLLCRALSKIELLQEADWVFRDRVVIERARRLLKEIELLDIEDEMKKAPKEALAAAMLAQAPLKSVQKECLQALSVPPQAEIDASVGTVGRRLSQHERDVARGKAGTKQTCKSCGKSAFSAECSQCRQRRTYPSKKAPCRFCGKGSLSGCCSSCHKKGLDIPHEVKKTKSKVNPLIVHDPPDKPDRSTCPPHVRAMDGHVPEGFTQPYVHPVTRFSEPRQYPR